LPSAVAARSCRAQIEDGRSHKGFNGRAAPLTCGRVGVWKPLHCEDTARQGKASVLRLAHPEERMGMAGFCTFRVAP
jgi:hypothetical protein